MGIDKSYEEKIKAYTLEELYEVKKRIDSATDPERYSLVLKEIENRKNGTIPEEIQSSETEAAIKSPSNHIEDQRDINDPYKAPESNLEIEKPYSETGGELKLASKWLRLGGSLIDGLLELAQLMAIAYYLGFYDNLISGVQITSSDQIILILFSLSIFMIINGSLIYKRGQTVGKLVCGTRGVTLDGSQVSGNTYVFLRLAPMWALTRLPFVGGLIWLVDSLLIFRKDRNCLHDDIAKTRVIKI